MSNYLFRAKDCCGAVVEGGIYDTGKEVFIVDCFQFIPVKRGTVEQFIATDKNGNNISENDLVIRNCDGKRVKARLDHQGCILDGYIISATKEATS